MGEAEGRVRRVCTTARGGNGAAEMKGRREEEEEREKHFLSRKARGGRRIQMVQRLVLMAEGDLQ